MAAFSSGCDSVEGPGGWRSRMQQQPSVSRSDLHEHTGNCPDDSSVSCIDGSRRSSLGAESLQEHDMSDEGPVWADYDSLLQQENPIGLEYLDEFFAINREKDRRDGLRNYMLDQPQINEDMRCSLINWLVKVTEDLLFSPETVFLAVSVTDRFLSRTPIAQDCFQLLAVCSLFIAAKMEESSVPGISALVTLCGSLYGRCHFRSMEALILSTLDFKIHTPTPLFFLTSFTLKSIENAPLNKILFRTARLVLEISLGCYRICQFLASEQAAAALTLSIMLTHLKETREARSRLFIDEMKEPWLPDIEVDVLADENVSFQMISEFNKFSENVIAKFKEIFSRDELIRVKTCTNLMKRYTRPFLQGCY